MEGHFWLKSVKDEYQQVLKETRFLIKVDKGLGMIPREGEDEFAAPGTIIPTLRKPSVADVSVKALKKLARTRSNSIGFDHSVDFE